MNNSKSRILVLLIVLSLGLFNSCKEKTSDIKFSKFPKIVTLKGKPVGLEEKFKGCLLNCYDSLLILTSVQGSSHPILIYNLNSFKYLASAINIGRGPKEIINPGFIILDKKNGYIWCQDLAVRSLWRFSIDSILVNSHYFPTIKGHLPDFPVPLQLDVNNDTTFSFIGNDPTLLIQFFDTTGTIIDSLSIHNKLKIYKTENLSFETKNFIAYYNYLMNKQTGEFCIIYNRSDIIAILDSKGNIKKIIRGPGRVDQVPEYGNSEQIITNSLVQSDEDYIYCLYKNQKRYDDLTRVIPNYSNRINIYNWKGDPVYQVVCDYKVLTFTIDRSKSRIITFSPDIDDIVIYDFPYID